MLSTRFHAIVCLCVWLVQPFVLRAAEPVVPTEILGQRVSVKDGHLVIGFDILAGFPLGDELLNLSPEDLFAKIPAEIRGLDGKLVVIRGLMMPAVTADDRVTEFLLIPEKFEPSSASICNAFLPAHLNQWVVVRCPKQPVKDVAIRPVSVCGRLKVAVVTENGQKVCIYSLDLDKVAKETAVPKLRRPR